MLPAVPPESNPRHAPSYYAATARGMISAPPLTGSAEADVCVIGGGFTGLSAALNLAERGYSVAVLEANLLGWGASGRNGGQLGSGQRVDQAALEAMVGPDDARRLWDIGEAAKREVRDRIARHGIDCDLKQGILSVAIRPRDHDRLRREAEHLEQAYGYKQLEVRDRATLRSRLASNRYCGGVVDWGAGHLHPLNLALGLARAAAAAGARLFEQSRVTRIGARPAGGDTPRLVRVGDHEIRCRYVVVACNGYLGTLSPTAAERIMPIQNMVIATEPLGAEAARLIADDVAVSDQKFVVDYYRLSADGRLLFGGGETYGFAPPDGVEARVRPLMVRVFPQLAGRRIDYAWSGQLAITRSRLPYLDRTDGTLFHAIGYSGHGVALAVLAGRLIAEAVDGTAARFDVMSRLPTPRFPLGRLLRRPALVAAMSFYAMLDRLP